MTMDIGCKKHAERYKKNQQSPSLRDIRRTTFKRAVTREQPRELTTKVNCKNIFFFHFKILFYLLKKISFSTLHSHTLPFNLSHSALELNDQLDSLDHLSSIQYNLESKHHSLVHATHHQIPIPPTVSSLSLCRPMDL